MDLAGWEAFVHGVFAITITLLVLGISVPPVDATPSGAALVEALLARVPEYGAYLLSFMYVGAYWIATHRSLRMVQGVDHGFLVVGLLYLMSIAVLPFVSSLLAQYIGADKGRDQVVVIVFSGWQFVASLLAYLTLLYSSRAGLSARLRLRLFLGPASLAARGGSDRSATRTPSVNRRERTSPAGSPGIR
jgi:uncharacterized membrane protein